MSKKVIKKGGLFSLNSNNYYRNFIDLISFHFMKKKEITKHITF